MSELKKILEIGELSGTDTIELWTNSFKVKGTLLTEKAKVEKGIVSIKDAVVSSLMHECDEECGCIDRKVEWLNVFDDQVIAFTFVK